MTGSLHKNTKMTDTLAQLAAEMVPCPSDLRAIQHRQSCACRGSGTVPLVLGLRKLCWLNLDSGDHQYDEVEHDDDLGIHPAVGCPGYTLVSRAEALLVLLEWTRRNGYAVRICEDDPASPDCFVIVEDRDTKEHYGRGANAPDAVANTLAKARGLEEGT